MTRLFASLITCCFLFATPAFGQIDFGLKVGLGTEGLQEETFDLSRSGRADLSLALSEASYGFQFGALLRVPFSEKFGIQTEATLNTATATFRFDDPDQSGTQVFRERYTDLQVPLLASWRLLFLRFNVGPVGHFKVASASDLVDAEGRERAFESFNLGYAIGGSLDIGPLTFDLRYDGNFSRYGDSFTVAGTEFEVNQAARRWVGSVAYRF